MDPQLLLVIIAAALPFVIYGVAVLIGKYSKNKQLQKEKEIVTQSQQPVAAPVPKAEDPAAEAAEVPAASQANADEPTPPVAEDPSPPVVASKPVPPPPRNKKRLFAGLLKGMHRRKHKQAGGITGIRQSEPGLGGGEAASAASSKVEPTIGTVATENAEPRPTETVAEHKPKIVRDAPAPEVVATAPEPEVQPEVVPEPVVSPEPAEVPAPVIAPEPVASTEPTSTDKEISLDDFPKLNADVLNEHFYYVVKIMVVKGMQGATTLKMASELVNKTAVERYQVILGFDDGNKDWEKPRPDKSYTYLVWAVPLSSRNSKMTAEERAIYVRVIQDQMRKLAGVAKFPAHQDIEERLEDVDQFLDKVDLAFEIHLIAKEGSGKPQKAGDIIELAQFEKMEEVEGRIVRLVNGEKWYELNAGNNEKLGRKPPERPIASLSLFMDVPHVSNTESAYDDMFKLAEKLARVLNFVLVDYNNDELNAELLQENRNYVMYCCAEMIQRGVRPGSKLARALFS